MIKELVLSICSYAESGGVLAGNTHGRMLRPSNMEYGRPLSAASNFCWVLPNFLGLNEPLKSIVGKIINWFLE